MHEKPLTAPYAGELERASAAVERFRRLAGAPDAPWGIVQKALLEERCGGILRELKNISRRVTEISVASRGTPGRAASGPASDPVSYLASNHSPDPASNDASDLGSSQASNHAPDFTSDPVSYSAGSHASDPGSHPPYISVSRSAAGSRMPHCRAAPNLFPTRSARPLAPGVHSSLFVFGRAAGRTRPGDVYTAARTDERGVVVCTAGPFATRADAASFVAEQFGGQGYAVRLELVFRRG